LVRIGLDKNNLYFPEVSAGRHRIIIRFCSTNDEDKPIQIDQELEFLIGMI
jgi:cell division FtsZ-interacting protein ZapD